MARAVSRALVVAAFVAWTGASSPTSADERSDGGARPAQPELASDQDPDESPLDDQARFDVRARKSIERGVSWLRAAQRLDGSWGSSPAEAGASGPAASSALGGVVPTAIALHALLKSGVPADAQETRRALGWLEVAHDRNGPAMDDAVVLLAVCSTADPFKRSPTTDTGLERIRTRLTEETRRSAGDLVTLLVEKRSGRRGWLRPSSPESVAPSSVPDSEVDTSVTSLVTLALFAADRLGLEVPTSVWRDVLDGVLSQQEPDGPRVPRAGDGDAKPKPGVAVVRDRARGFADRRMSPDPDARRVTGATTACGLATVCMARRILGRRADAAWASDTLRECSAQAVWDALAWMDVHWRPFGNPEEPGVHDMVWLFGIERSMDVMRRSRIGEHVWYVEGATALFDRQTAEGSWRTGPTHEASEVIDTSLALLYLRRPTISCGFDLGRTTPVDPEPQDNRGR